MPALPKTHLISLHSQHSIQSHDLLTVWNLAQAEGMAEGCESHCSFEQFLGLAIHLLVTTQSQQTREQLAQQLTKFGSAAVLPVAKILYRMDPQSRLRVLAQQILDQMEPYPLIIGLSQVLDRETDEDLRAIAVQMLMNLIQNHERPVLLLLPKLVSQTTWRLLKRHLLAEISYPTGNNACLGNSLSLGF